MQLQIDAPTMKTYVEFRSDRFPPYEGEDSEVNPGLFGKRLAEFIVRGLSQKGFQPLEPIAEDWGWLVPIKNDRFSLWIGCGNQSEYSDGFLCFIEPHKPTIRRFGFLWKVDTSKQIGELQAAMNDLLSAEPGINEIKWWSHEEFNRPTD